MVTAPGGGAEGEAEEGDQMNGFLKQARAAFQENLNLIDSGRDPVMYNFYAGMVSLVSGLEVELARRYQGTTGTD